MLADGRLPDFTLGEYETLLRELRTLGFQFQPMLGLRAPVAPGERSVFLRHDIDMHLRGVEEVAYLEASLGVRAAYYVPLTLHFNPLQPENRAVLRALIDSGHEVGLHYDLETYPTDRHEARRHLDWECGVLQALTGQPPRTICMHQPHKDEKDPFRELNEYLHPHDPRLQDGLVYVSDSCRAWRDATLTTVASERPPRRLLLATHPELWLGTPGLDRAAFLERVLLPNGTAQARSYFDETVRTVWENHSAPRLHDLRERKRQ